MLARGCLKQCTAKHRLDAGTAKHSTVSELVLLLLQSLRYAATCTTLIAHVIFPHRLLHLSCIFTRLVIRLLWRQNRLPFLAGFAVRARHMILPIVPCL